MGGHGVFSDCDRRTSTQYPVLPAGAVSSGDFYEFSSTSTNSAKPSEIVNATKLSANLGAVSLTFPSPWSYAGPSPAALPSFNFSYSGFSGNDGVFDSGLLGWTTSNSFNQYLLIASSNYLQGSARPWHSLIFPNIEGFIAQPPSGTEVNWIRPHHPKQPGCFAARWRRTPPSQRWWGIVAARQCRRVISPRATVNSVYTEPLNFLS